MYCIYRAPVSSLVVTGNLLAFSNTMKCTVFVSVGISKQCNATCGRQLLFVNALHVLLKTITSGYSGSRLM